LPVRPMTAEQIESHNRIFSVPPEGFRTLSWTDTDGGEGLRVAVAELAKVRLDEMVAEGKTVRIHNTRTAEFIREVKP
jgi:hypothetical protein